MSRFDFAILDEITYIWYFLFQMQSKGECKINFCLHHGCVFFSSEEEYGVCVLRQTVGTKFAERRWWFACDRFSFFFFLKEKKQCVLIWKLCGQKNILVLQLIGWSWTCLCGCALKFYDRMVSRKISPIFLYKILTALVIISKLGKWM